MSFVIRRARFSDAPALAGLLREVGWFEAVNSMTPAQAAVHIELHLAECLANESHSVYIGEDENGMVAGYISIHWLAYLFLPAPEGFISELFVRSDAHGQGLGTDLLETVKTEALERGAHRLSLLNGKQRESYLRGFYQARGWQERPGMANFVYLLPDD